MATKPTEVLTFELSKEDLAAISGLVDKIQVTSQPDPSKPGAFIIRNHSFKTDKPGAFVIRNHNFSTDRPGAYTIRNYKLESKD